MRRSVMALLSIIACAGLAIAQQVGTEHDRTFDFSKIQTFAVKTAAPANDAGADNGAREAITKRLMEKGWKPADENSCDALVVVHVASKGKDTMQAFYEAAPDMKWQNVGAPKLADSDDYEYKPGTLVVDIFEAKTRRAIFRGVAVNRNPENAEILDKEAKKMFKSLPTASKSPKSASATQQP
ncbi:MAG TPA: DUF4136 domain-containing protein [Candidatus Angelobacter sp.]|jgi:hypothetical protein|nr:DUF4136 domain-containing protein [Candidatus Angelobacter sp.]